ncbi:LPXTG cell wall anchor domain-containing protein [Streptomyces verrucosisporus]|uniref:LPXTG cell wall anchor domain-containing protein n=1 Tax=Streptomyces verrucosisporus TaxID=1695161 RepID=UPI0019D0BDE2|nr:LPXTG cell wall anchor domain-containing protein [Streptomyces verrucosisporus]MBN3929032.1 LPXTG cell wall anchor domain-containing protein [Streptomyces verrucosisporus]
MRILTSTRAAAVVAASCMALAPAAPAFATGSSSPELRQPLPITAAEFERGECPESIPADKDGWHFVLPGGGKDKPEFVKLTVTFEPGGTQTITEFGPPSDKHAYVASEPGAKLVDIEAEIKGSVKDDKFNLSHTCPATDTTGGSTGETTGETTAGTTTGSTGETTAGTTTGGGGETTGGSTEGTTEGTTGETTEGTTGETTEGAAGGEETTGGTEGSTAEGSTGETTEGVAGGEEPGASTGEGGNLAETGSEAPVAALAAAAAALLGAGAYLVMRRRKATQG